MIMAIGKAGKAEKGRDVIVIEPITGVSVDAAELIHRKVELLRNKEHPRPIGKRLKEVVEEAVFSTDFEIGRRRAYVLVLMQYYLMLRHRDTRIARMKRRKTPVPTPREEFQLTG